MSNETPPAPGEPDDHFPVAPRPPRSHYWPKRERAERKHQQQLNRIVQALISEGPHLRGPNRKQYRMLLRATAMHTHFLERAYKKIVEAELINPETGELRASFDVFSRLIVRQLSLLQKLGLTPAAEIQSGSHALLDGVFERIQKAYAARHGNDDEGVIESSETTTPAEVAMTIVAPSLSPAARVREMKAVATPNGKSCD